MEGQETGHNMLKLQRLARTIANSPESIFILDTMIKRLPKYTDLSWNESYFSEIQKCFKLIFKAQPQEGTPDFLKMNCSCICLSEELIQLTVGNASEEMTICYYIRNVLEKVFGILIELPNSLQNIDIKAWLEEKQEYFRERNCTPNVVILKYIYNLSEIQIRKEDLIANLRAISLLARNFQLKSIIPIIQVHIEYQNIPSLSDTIHLLQKILGELIYSLQVSEVQLEAMILSLPVVGSHFLLKDNTWIDWSSVEKIVFLNHMAWLRTIPPAIPSIILHEGENLGKQHFIRQCEIINQINKLQLDCPWSRTLSLEKSMYSFIFEAPEEWTKDEKLTWNLFIRRLKVSYDCFAGQLDYKKIIPIASPHQDSKF